MRQLDTRFTALFYVVTLTIGASLVGCGPAPGNNRGEKALPLDAESAALTAKSNVEANLKTLEEAFETIQEIELFDSAVAQVGVGAVEDVPPVEAVEPAAKPSEAALSFLEEKVMVEEQLESDDGTYVVYLLKADIFCTSFKKGGDLCTEILDAYPVRVMFQSFGEGDLDISVRFGEAAHTPLTFKLHTNALGLRVDLGVAKKVVDDIAAIIELDPELPLPETLTGVIEIVLSSKAPKTAELALKVLSPVTVDIAGVSATIGTSTLTAMADGIAKSLSVDVKVGPVAADLPYQALVDLGADTICTWTASEAMDTDPASPGCKTEETPKVSGTISAILPGITGAMTVSKDSDTLTISGLGLGDDTATVTLDGTPLLSFDLNPASGRTIDVSFALDAAKKSFSYTFAPGLDATLAMNLSPVAAHLDVPDWTLSDTLKAAFEGAAPTIELIEKQLHVLGGNLTLSSSASPADTVTATDGMCLVEGPGGGHPLLSKIAAAACE